MQDGNQVHEWLRQKDVLSSIILRCDSEPFGPESTKDGAEYTRALPPTLAIKPHDAQWPQVRLHPPIGSKLDLVGTGAIAEHARKPLSKSSGESLMVFVGRRMVDEKLIEIPAMTQACPWDDGRPVPQPMDDVAPQYGALRGVKLGQVFASLGDIQRAGAHSHVGFHGRAVSSTVK